MSTFSARMLAAKRIRQEERNRGLSIGDFRGTVKPRTADVAYRDMEQNIQPDWLEGFANDLHWIVAELNDATIADLAATF